ncbi:MAG: alanine racemase [Pseudomonadota bacterium]
MTRPAVARIDLDALRHNYALARQLHGGRALAVLKADAYGHGSTRCAQALQGLADAFAVAFLEEAVTLREAGIDAPILILEGAFDADEIETIARLRLWTVVHHETQLKLLEGAAARDGVHVWLKVDSGMGRAGFALKDVARVHGRLTTCRHVAEVTLMTHFARADEPDSSATAAQIAVFDAATRSLPGPRSLCNSAGVMAWNRGRRDWARPGIMLYGANPFPQGTHDLRPVMSLRSEVFATRDLMPGDALGYGATFVAERPTRVGLVALGYADGYPRGAPNGTPVSVDGTRTHLIGRVSMDMLTVDLTDLPASGIGSIVELWGSDVSVADVAQRSGTISYELLCNVKRVRRVYAADPSRGPH